MAKELDEMRKAEEKNNESAALKLAIEERRAQMVRAQAKRDMECKDAEFARLSILHDIDSDFKLEEKCKDDEAYALKVSILCELHSRCKLTVLNRSKRR